MTAGDELFELFGKAAEQRRQQDLQMKLMISLLRGDVKLFGRYRVEIVFPDGQPDGKSNAEIADDFDFGARGEYIPPKHLKKADVALQAGWVQWRGDEARA